MADETLTEMLIRHEGLRLFPYEDSLGVLTIGVGRNLRDCGISEAEAMLLLRHDLDQCVDDLRSFPWWTHLTDVRRRAFVDMRFNLGPTKFRQFKAMIAALERGDFMRAAAQMRQSLWARQVKSRAEELAQMVEHG